MMESFSVHGNSLFKTHKESTQFYHLSILYPSIVKTGIKFANQPLNSILVLVIMKTFAFIVDDDYLGVK